MNNASPRAAVIGTGFIGPVHVEAPRCAGTDVVALVGSSPEKSVQAAQSLGVADDLRTFEDVLASPKVDAVHLTTPNRLHYRQAAAALQAGKHVLCEKPLAMNRRQTAELVRLAAASGRAAAVAYNIRYYPLCQEAAARVEAGELGRILHVHGSYVQDWLLYPTDFNWRVLAKEGGQPRAVADIGTHWLDLVQFITGRKIVEVCADLRVVHPRRQLPEGGSETFSQAGESVGKASNGREVEIDTEDCGAVLLRMEGDEGDDGANGCLWVSQTTAGRKNCLRLEIGGGSSAVAWNSEQPNQLWIGHRGSPNEQLLRDPSLLHPAAAAACAYPGGHNEGFPDTFKQLFLDFYDYIRRGDFDAPATFPTFPTFADGHREVVLAEAVLASHRRRSWTAVEP